MLDHRPEELAFYAKMGVPAPTLQPLERRRLRMTFRNERTLYTAVCAATKKPVLSIYAPSKGYTIYDFHYWHSDQWSGLAYGRDMDFSRPFFAQWRELFLAAPKMNLVNDSFCENSDYVNQAGGLKDCYMVFSGDSSEKCLYCHRIINAKECVDCELIVHSELCYGCINCKESYNLRYAEECISCRDSAFLVDCRDCTNCLGCFGLRHQQYQVFNQQLTKEEYEQRFAAYRLETMSGRDRFMQEFETWLGDRRGQVELNKGIENSRGIYLENTTDCFMGDACIDVERCAYVSTVFASKDCVDVDIWGRCELVYECVTVGDNANTVAFSSDTWGNVHDIWYCNLCTRSKHLFGCVSMKDAEYCILNKQYTKEEYEALVPRIIAYMKQTGEWGQFFPASLSPFGYNETIANEFFPLQKEEALAKGFSWYEEALPPAPSQGYTPEDDINVYRDATKTQELLAAVLVCAETGRPFKILPQELAFYLKMGIPVPRISHNARYTPRRRKVRGLQY